MTNRIATLSLGLFLIAAAVIDIALFGRPAT